MRWRHGRSRFGVAHRRGSLLHRWLGALAALAVMLGMAGVASPAAYGEPAALVVLDPDDNLAHGLWDGTDYTELPITYEIAVQAKAKLEVLCDVAVVITRDASANSVSRASRAAQMVDADVSLTISLNALTGTPWGTASDGGAQAWASGFANNIGFAQRTLDAWTQFTGRPADAGVNEGATNGTTYPYPEFADLPGTYAQTFFGYIDGNFDWPAISGIYNGLAHGFLIDAVVTAVGQQLQDQGIACGDTTTGQTAFPAPPSADELFNLFLLGSANYMRYGSDPVNFATGNFLQNADLFSIPGPGGVLTPIALSYNSLDKRSGPFGIGWSSGLAVRSQTYDNGTVLITGDDGSSVAYGLNGNGSYSALLPGIHSTLSRTAERTLVRTMPDTSTQTFTEDAITGAGAMVQRIDRAGHVWTYTYATVTTTTPGIGNQWPVAPDGSSAGSSTPDVTVTSLGALQSIVEPGGRTITFASDEQSRITAVTRPDGAAWSLTYTAVGELASITDPAGNSTSYAYDGEHRMLSVTGPDGVTYVSNTYDELGRVVRQVNGDGNASTIAYGQGSTTYTDTTGASTVFAMDDQKRVTSVVTPLGHTISTGYADWATASSTDANGRTTSYAYDSSGNLIARTDPMGASRSWAYTASGDLVSETDELGRTTTYTVDANGRTTAIAGPDGAHWAQTFDGAGNLTSRTDPNGNVTAFAYDGHGNLVSVTDAAGGMTSLAYDSADRLVASTDPLGRVSTYAYDVLGRMVSATRPSGAATTYSYTATGQVASVTDPEGNITSYTYTTGLNVASVTLPGGGVWEYGYDSEYRRTSVTDPDGNTTQYAYDAEGLLASTTAPDGAVTTRTYDPAQNLISVTDPLGAMTSIAYDAANRPVTVTDALGGVTAFAYDKAGQLTSVTDPNGQATTYAYDQAGRVVTVTDPAGGIASYEYDQAGNQTSSTGQTGRVTALAYDALNRLIGSTDPAGATTAYGYDAASQLTSVTDPEGRVTAYSYTADGQTAGLTDNAGAVTSYAYDGNGNITGITDPRGSQVSFSYTPTGQLRKATDQNGHTTSYAYTAAGVLASMTDALGIVTSYQHDAAGRLSAVTANQKPGSAPSADVNVWTGYAYDRAGQLSSVTDPLGNTTSYARDQLGRVTGVTDASGNTAHYAYDPVGQVVSATDADGRTTGYGYTPTRLLASIAPPAGQGSASTYVYDAAGRLSSMADDTGTSSWSYTAAGLVSSTTDGAGKTLTYGYDSSGLRTSMAYPDGTQVTYTLDAVGRTASQTDASGTVAYSYDKAGQLTSIDRPNGAASAYAYDPAGLISSIAHTGTALPDGGSGAPGDPITGPGCGNGGVTPGCPQTALTAADALPMTLTYGRDPSGRITAMRQQSATKDLTTSYAYDKLGRLLSSTRTDGASDSYRYDAASNLVAGSETDRITGQLLEYTSTYSATGQLLSTTAIPKGSVPTKRSPIAPGTVATTNGYDKSGRRVSQAVATTVAVDGNSGKTETTTLSAANTYDYAGRILTSTLSDGRATSYTYDGLGRTVAATLPDPTAATGTTTGNGGNGHGSGHTDGPGCGNGGITPGCPGLADASVFAGHPVTIANDGMTPIAWNWADGAINLMNGPQGPDHQAITRPDSTAAASWFHLDALFSPRATSDADGATTAAQAWTDYGASEPASGTVWNGPNPGHGAPGQIGHQQAGPNLPVISARTPLGYTSQLPNPGGSPDGNGLLHFQARDYQPGNSTWLAPDPLGALGLLLYTYVNGDPINLIDPDGRAPANIGAALGKTIGLGGGLTPNPAPNPGTALGVALGSTTAKPAPPGPSSPTPPTDPQNPSQDSGRYQPGCDAVCQNNLISLYMTGTSCNSPDPTLCAYYQAMDQERRNDFWAGMSFLNALKDALDPCQGSRLCAAGQAFSNFTNLMLSITGISGCANGSTIDCAGFVPWTRLLKAGALNKLDDMLRAANFGREINHATDVGQISKEMAEGHGFSEHGTIGNLPAGVTTRAQYADVIESIIANPQEMRQLANQRWAFYREGTVVVVDVNADDFGTAFAASYSYFLGLA